MSSGLYNIAAYKLMTAASNWVTTDMVLVAWGGAPLFDPAHNNVGDVEAAVSSSPLGVSLDVLGKAVTADGTGKSDTVVVPGVGVGETVTWFTLCRKDAVLVNMEMILFIDDALGLPFIGNGNDLVVQPDWTLAQGWFRP